MMTSEILVLTKILIDRERLFSNFERICLALLLLKSSIVSNKCFTAREALNSIEAPSTYIKDMLGKAQEAGLLELTPEGYRFSRIKSNTPTRYVDRLQSLLSSDKYYNSSENTLKSAEVAAKVDLSTPSKVLEYFQKKVSMTNNTLPREYNKARELARARYLLRKVSEKELKTGIDNFLKDIKRRGYGEATLENLIKNKHSLGLNV